MYSEKRFTKIAAIGLTVLIASLAAQSASAKTVQVTMEAMEKEVEIDNSGTTYPAWTFGGTIPGPVVRVKEGDTVDFKLVNPASNRHPHSMDFHAAVVDVTKEFSAVNPGETKHFTFRADHPGVFVYHCGASPMPQHIARGMYGIIIVDPKEGYSNKYPKPDREYVLVQGQYFPNAEDVEGMTVDKGWTNALINGKIFHYDPAHDPNARFALQAEPGERVRIFFANANLNNPVAMHPVAGIWDRVYINGNPQNTLYGLQAYNVAVGEASTFDIVSPRDRSTTNAIVDHAMKAAMRGAITILVNSPDADPGMGKGENILPR